MPPPGLPPFPTLAARPPRAVPPRVDPGVHPFPTRERAGRLHEIMAALKAALWEAWGDPLELIALEFGAGVRPFLDLDQAGADGAVAWLEHVYPPDRAGLEAFFSGARSLPARRPLDYRMIHASGELLWVRHWILERRLGAGRRVRWRGLLTAIDEQKRVEWECLRVSERERNRIGQELHDDLCQVLAGLSCLMEVLSRQVVREAPALRRTFGELQEQIVEAMQRTRLMAHGLYPAQLRGRTLRQVLRELVAQTATRFALPVELALPPGAFTHAPGQILQVYRLVQEAVSNALRHGRATQVRIAFRAPPGRVELRIEDNGAGFPAQSARPEGIGLHVMAYRARVLGGALTFGNRAGGGAFVQLQYPRIGTRGDPAGVPELL